VRQRAFATCLDRELKHPVQLVFGNHERSPPILVTLQQRSLTGSFGSSLARISWKCERKTWVQRRHTAPVTLHRTSNVRPLRSGLAPAMRIVVLLDTRGATVPFRPSGMESSPTGLVMRAQARLHRGVSSSPTVFSIRRPVIRVNHIRIMLPHREHEFHISFCDLVDACHRYWCRRRSGALRGQCSKQQ